MSESMQMNERDFDCIKHLVAFARMEHMTKGRMREMMSDAGFSKDEVIRAIGHVSPFRGKDD